MVNPYVLWSVLQTDDAAEQQRNIFLSKKVVSCFGLAGGCVAAKSPNLFSALNCKCKFCCLCWYCSPGSCRAHTYKHTQILQFIDSIDPEASWVKSNPKLRDWGQNPLTLFFSQNWLGLKWWRIYSQSYLNWGWAYHQLCKFCSNLNNCLTYIVSLCLLLKSGSLAKSQAVKLKPFHKRIIRVHRAKII